jgi:hypothetical protein
MEPLQVIAMILCGVYVIFDELQQHSEKNGWNKRLHPTGEGRWNMKIRPWLNNETSWKNKHNMEPRWLFSTVLVWLTDGEHFFQMLKHVVIAAIVAILTSTWWMFIVGYAAIALMSGIMNELVLKRGK